jgi:hypothetical protein
MTASAGIDVVGRVRTEAGRITSERDQFGYVLGLIALILVLRAWVGDTAIGLFLSVALGGVTLAFILHTCGVHRRLLRGVEAVVVVGIVLSGIGLLFGTDRDGHQIAGLFGLMIAFLAPLAIVRRIAKAPVITFRIVLGALAIYLLFGLAYSYLYSFIAFAQATPFFNQTDGPSSAIYMYFSYVTMTTVGYGDFTARTDLGKLTAVSQALLGQLYLVSVVAVIIANLGRVRHAPGTPGGDTATVALARAEVAVAGATAPDEVAADARAGPEPSLGGDDGPDGAATAVRKTPGASDAAAREAPAPDGAGDAEPGRG